MNNFSQNNRTPVKKSLPYRFISEITVLFFFLSLSTCLSPVNSSNILAVFPHVGKSHQDVFQPLVDGLARRGHNLTVISFFPKKEPMTNYTDIPLDLSNMPVMLNSVPISFFEGMTIYRDFSSITEIGLECCERFYSTPAVQELLSSGEKFDLIITELFQIDCFLGIIHKLKAPFIAMSSSILFVNSNERFANPDNPAFIPNILLGYSDKMSYHERFINTLFVYLMKFMRTYYFDITSERIARKYIGKDMPPLSEIAKNTSLVLVNSHPSLNHPKPQVPAVIDVGGMHIAEEKKLPPDLQKYLDDSIQGVILFSMGSVLLTHSLPEEKRKIFMEVFAELPQNIICKWENDTLPNKPKNVKILKWLPQRDILAHPNIIAFISHGGLLGTCEAVFCGVPIIGMPMYGDQRNNVRAVESSGAGIYLTYSTLTKESFRNAITSVINNKKYMENAKRLSELYRHRQSPPLETAIFWSEHVIKFGGGEHLRVAAVDMPWYQYLLLDVIAGFIALLTFVLYIVYKTAYMLTIFIISHSSHTENKTKKKL